MVELLNQFAHESSRRSPERLNQRKWFIKAKEDREKKEELAEQAEANLLALAVDVALATEQQIKQFELRLQAYEVRLAKYDSQLDQYDEAVTRALMEQMEKLDILKAEKADMLENAFVLEDGRRVFLSSDGSYAVDETGTRLNEVEFAENDIPHGKRTAEQFEQKLADIEKVTKSIDELHAAQEEINKAREQSAKANEALDRGKALLEQDEITIEELEDLESDLEAEMPKSLPNLPTSAMKHISGINVDNAPKLENSFTSASTFKPAIDNSTDTSIHTPDNLAL